MKRKFTDYECSLTISNSTRSKKPCLIQPISFGKDFEYISASQVINYIQDDCLLDWLKIRKDIQPNDRRFSEENYLTSQGNKFEQKVIEWINYNIYPSIKVNDPIEFNDKYVEETIRLMKINTPIIYSAALKSQKYKIYGTADLLVRNDYLHKLFSDFQGNADERQGKYYYVVVDIKWCTLQLCSDGKTLQNVERFPGYKGQLLIYNRCLEEMQGYFPKSSYILGRRYNYTKEGVKKGSFSPFVRPGICDMTNTELHQKVDNAIEWLRDLRRFGNVWTLTPPSRIELYPNLGSSYYYTKKKELAEKIGDLSLLYNVKSDKKRRVFQKGIYTIFDKRLDSKILGIKGKDASIVDKILKINREEGDKFNIKKSKNNLYNWKTNENEIFVDFEKFTDLIDNFENIANHKPFDMIFLIGVYFKDVKGDWMYKYFLAEQPNYLSEKKLLQDFVKFVIEQGNPKIWYYFAEEKFWNSAMGKHQDLKNDLNFKLNWRDLRQVMIEEEFVVKDCYDYKLKSVICAMKRHNLIQIETVDECSDGMMAMLDGWQYYQSMNENIIKPILKYNKFDVEAIYSILQFLRKEIN